MKKTGNMMLALTLTVMLLLCGSTASAAGADSGEQSLRTLLEGIVAMDDSGRVADKAETVYVIAQADGTADRVITSEWLKNPDGADTLTDATQLRDIENTNGFETYTQSDGALVWNANGRDIHYQGTADQPLPVTVKITYWLDGKQMTAEDIAGQSGHAVIRFAYENHTAAAVAIGGEMAEVSVPFLLVSGLVLSNDAFSNVTVSSGTVYNDGSRNIVVGYAFPGLTQSLALDASEYSLPETVEIEADTTNFSLPATLSVAVNGLLGKLRFNGEGLTDWNSELTEFDTAASLLSDGAAQLSAGAGALQNGLGSLSENSASLTDGAQTIFSSLAAVAQQQINTALAAAGMDAAVTLTPVNYEAQLSQLLTAVQGAAKAQASAAAQEQVLAAVTQQVVKQVQAQVTETVTAQVKEQVLAQLTASLTAKGYTQQQAAAYLQTDDGQALLQTNLEQQTASDTVQQLIQTYTDAQMATAEVQTAITSNVARQMQSDAVQAQIEAAAAQGLAQNETYQSILALQAQLDGIAAFCDGLSIYTAGVDDACEGAQTLAAGADTLAQKVKQFYTDGVQTLTAALQVDSEELLDRLQAVAEADRAFQSFGGIAPDMNGSVKFIWRTDGI